MATSRDEIPSQEETSRVNEEEEVDIRSIVADEITNSLEKVVPYIIATLNDDFRRIVREEIEDVLKAKVVHDDDNVLTEGGDRPVVNVEKKDDQKGCSYKDFSSCKPPNFLGEPNPVVSMRWLKEVEGAFLTSKCAEKDKVIYAANLLRNRAKYWWEVVIESQSGGDVTKMKWDEFKEKFLEHYCPQSAIDKITQEFLFLKQGNKSVNDITGEFLDKARFCSHYVANEKLKMERYLSCLNGEIREHVVTSNPSTFEAMVEVARRREMELSIRVEEERRKRKVEFPQASYKRPKFNLKGRREMVRRPEFGSVRKDEFAFVC